MDDFTKLAKILKREFPEYNVSIRRVKMSPKTGGTCEKKGKKFFIKINNKGEKEEQILILIHEFSHILGWDDPADHGIKWGKSYSKVYNVYLEKFVNGPDE